jgi:hypothetical protein
VAPPTGESALCANAGPEEPAWVGWAPLSTGLSIQANHLEGNLEICFPCFCN